MATDPVALKAALLAAWDAIDAFEAAETVVEAENRRDRLAEGIAEGVAPYIDAGGAAVTIGAFGSSPDAKGATASGSQITLQPADGTHPGAVSITTQTIAGAKTYTDPATVDSTTAAQNGQFHAKNNQTDAFTAFRAYDSAGAAKISFGYANSGTVAPFTSGAYISAASGTVTRFLTASAITASISTGGVWDFVSRPTFGGVSLVSLSSADVLTSKTLTTPTINGAALSGSLTGSPNFTGSPTVSGAAIVTTTQSQTLSNKLITPEAWVAPTLTNSWVNFGGGLQTAAYYKDPTGRVFLRGLIKSGTGGAAAFTLPSGYRPTAQCLFIVSANNGAGDVAARIDVNTTGTVVPGTGGSVHFSLDGISFLVT